MVWTSYKGVLVLDLKTGKPVHTIRLSGAVSWLCTVVPRAMKNRHQKENPFLHDSLPNVSSIFCGTDLPEAFRS